LFLIPFLLTQVAIAAETTTSPTNLVAERAVRQFVGDCAGSMKFNFKPYDQSLPNLFRGTRVEVESDNPQCGGSYVFVSAPNEDYYVGSPWPLTEYQGTPEQKLKRFTWDHLKEAFEPIAHKEESRNGLYRVDLLQTTEHGKIPVSGYVDPQGTIFFLGSFVPAGKPASEYRLTQIASILKNAPTLGKADAKVTIYEFSDFECPSCRNATTFMKPLLERYADQVRYVRVDLPLVSSHPWAFNAALAGRAIYKQNPKAFWDYKEAIYSNQDKLNAFALEDFIQAFVADHDLDVKRFQKDVSSDAVRDEILASIATSFSVPVLGTPTFLVNGEIISAGENGTNLEKVLKEKLAAK
jgi:protein-disulfide isomerase